MQHDGKKGNPMTFRPRAVPVAGGSKPSPPGPEQITAGVPLAKLIKRKLINVPEIVMLHHPRSVAAEKFRRLKTILVNEAERSPRVIVVTSAGPGEGKSFVSVNLALSFAADKQGEVLLIDADLRRPTVERWLEPAPQVGFAELLCGRTESDHAILELQNSPLKVLPAGQPPRDPVELLSSDRLREQIAALRQRFGRIIIDTPPIVPFTDADAVGAAGDGVLLVARTGLTRRASFSQAVSAVTSTRILGTVLNESVFNLADRDTYGQEKYYTEYYKRTRKS